MRSRHLHIKILNSICLIHLKETKKEREKEKERKHRSKPSVIITERYFDLKAENNGHAHFSHEMDYFQRSVLTFFCHMRQRHKPKPQIKNKKL